MIQPSALPKAAGKRHGLLRAETKAAHSALDLATMKAGYFDSPVRYLAYLDRLVAFHALYAETATRCDTGGWRALWSIDRHPIWIAQELAAARGAAHHPSPSPMQTTTDFILQSRAAVLGSIYVLAGSALGARMLHRMTVTRAIPSEGGSSYLQAVAQSLRWQDFLTFLETADIGNDDTQLVEGALATFRCVHRTLENAP